MTKRQYKLKQAQDLWHYSGIIMHGFKQDADGELVEEVKK